MKNYLRLCILLILSFFTQAQAYDKPDIRGSRVVSLGSGYKTVTGVFLGERVQGTEGFHGAQMGEWKFKTNLSSAEKSNLINGNAEVSINYKVFTASGGLDLDYVSKKTDQSFSQTMYFDVVGKNVQLDRCKISDHIKGSIKKHNAEAIFGDSFVDTLTLGGRLVLDIAVTYGSDIDSTEVNGNVQLEVMKFIKGSANAGVKIQEILRKSEIIVRAKQIGGDTTQLSKLFQGEGSMASCSAGDYSKCTQVIKDVIQYGESFGQQLSGLMHDTSKPLGPAVIAFTTKPYDLDGLDVFPGSNPIVAKETLRLQQELTKEYFNLIEDIKYIDDKINAGLGNTGLDSIRSTIEKNVASLVSAIENSAEYPDATSAESNKYRSSKLIYQIPTSISVPSELFKICDNCQKREKLVPESSGKYRIMKNGDIPTCSRCNSWNVSFECRADNAVYSLSGRRTSGTTLETQGVHVRNKATIKISDHLKLDGLDSLTVEIRK